LIDSYLFTSESVTEGHPDKVCDQISDAVLDHALTHDPYARVAVETMVTTGLCVVAGEMTTDCYVPVAQLARQAVREIGYTRAKYGFDCDTMGVMVAIDEQSPDIARGVDTGGAGDQGMMFGYASNETPELMPMPILLAHRLAAKLAEVRKTDTLPYLRPDGKTQVTVRYEHEKPIEVTKVLMAAQHKSGMKQDDIRADLIEHVVNPVIAPELRENGLEVLVNRTGSFVVGGPQGDTGLTGRKIIVDTYGGTARHGGGAFSGKDPTKVDRSGSYMMRYIAKNIVAAGLAERCGVQVAYSIGDASPFSVQLWTFETNTIDNARIAALILEHFDLTPKGMIETLDLRRPIYKKTAAYGHFGRLDPEFTWERTDKAEALRKAAGL
jgi:S-adenosylmethionine synthetase